MPVESVPPECRANWPDVAQPGLAGSEKSNVAVGGDGGGLGGGGDGGGDGGGLGGGGDGGTDGGHTGGGGSDGGAAPQITATCARAGTQKQVSRADTRGCFALYTRHGASHATHTRRHTWPTAASPWKEDPRVYSNAKDGEKTCGTLASLHALPWSPLMLHASCPAPSTSRSVPMSEPYMW